LITTTKSRPEAVLWTGVSPDAPAEIQGFFEVATFDPEGSPNHWRVLRQIPGVGFGQVMRGFGAPTWNPGPLPPEAVRAMQGQEPGCGTPEDLALVLALEPHATQVEDLRVDTLPTGDADLIDRFHRERQGRFNAFMLEMLVGGLLRQAAAARAAGGIQ
jgi:hypothetical protein